MFKGPGFEDVANEQPEKKNMKSSHRIANGEKWKSSIISFWQS
jgi:hypothetical protein